MTLLGGRYETLKAIASGGMATVHLGRAVSVGGFERLVAIKVMHPHIAGEPEFVTMFLDEARLAARIRHPNVVPTLDVQQSEDGLFLVMEFIDGPSLNRVRTRLKKAAEAQSSSLQGCRSGGRLPLPVAIRIMVDVLAGLAAAHELADDEGQPLNLIHRDVTPANILVGADGQTRLTDFGVVRAETRLSSTRGGQLKGKVPYMPPEQLLGEVLDQRGDIYAAGVVLWEELVGRRLFAADNEGALLGNIIAAELERPRQADPEIPEALDEVTMKAIARDPEARYPSAAAFGEALEAAARSAGIAIASARAVATFLADSGVHKALDAKELGALKAGAVPSSRAVSLSFGEGSGPSLPSQATPAAHSSVTATEATFANAEPAPSSSRWALFGGLGIALLGLAGGFLVATRAGDPQQGSNGAAVPAAGEVRHDDTTASDASPTTHSSASASSAASVVAPATSASVAANPALPLPLARPGFGAPAATAPAVEAPALGAPARPVAPNANPRPRPRPSTFNPDRL